jgi:dolichol-phosphate mannosyltransferase
MRESGIGKQESQGTLQHNNHHPPPTAKTSIILPTYKERDNIVELVQAIHQHLGAEGFDYEVVVVDDNSPDGTAEAVRAAFGDNGRVKLHVRTQERGLATALRYGAEHSAGEVLVFMDTDFNHDPAMIPQLVKFLEYYDVVIGSRFVMRGGMEDPARYVFSFVYNLGLRFLFGTRVWDNLSGFFAIYRDKLLELDLDQIFYGYGDYFIRLLVVGWRRGWRMVEVPVFYRLRTHGHSKTQFLGIFGQYTTAILKLRLKLWMGRMR